MISFRMVFITRITSLFQKYRRHLLILLLLLAEIILPPTLVKPESAVPLSNLAPFSLAGYHRLVVFAPHCDDETLGAGGLILAAERAGIQVRVVIGTNGDGFFFATMRDFKKVYPTPADYIRLGKLRQQESLSALSILGVKPSQVDFLSYPDRGTPSLWENNWLALDPYRSPYSEDSRSPYPLTYDPHSVYAGEDYLADVTSILKSYQPDLVVYPNGDDVHPDHWGMNVFVRLAVNLLEHSDSVFHPAQYTYLVHRPDFPDLKGLKPQADLTPPLSVYEIDRDWYSLPLPAEDVALKAKAVRQYRSQLTLLRSLMDSFIRSNELFASVQDASLPVMASGNPDNPSTWLDTGGETLPPVQLDPTGDFITRTYFPASDLVALYAASDPHGSLHLCAEARENMQPELLYTLRWKAITSNGIASSLARSTASRGGGFLARRLGKYACVTLSLAQMGNPRAVFAGASVTGGGRVIDEIAWQMITIGAP